MIGSIHVTDDSAGHFVAHLGDETDTLQAGAALASGLEAGLVVYLIGDLGAGKTTLVRGCLRALGHTGKVKSPTYTLLEPYSVSRLNLYHFDFYRFNVPEEFLEAGLDEYFSRQEVCLIEWPDKAEPYLPDADIVIRLTLSTPGRNLKVAAYTEAGKKCVQTMMQNLQPPSLR